MLSLMVSSLTSLQNKPIEQACSPSVAVLGSRVVQDMDVN